MEVRPSENRTIRSHKSLVNSRTAETVYEGPRVRIGGKASLSKRSGQMTELLKAGLSATGKQGIRHRCQVTLAGQDNVCQTRLKSFRVNLSKRHWGILGANRCYTQTAQLEQVTNKVVSLKEI